MQWSAQPHRECRNSTDPREKFIEALARGMTYKEVAGDLGIDDHHRPESGSHFQTESAPFSLDVVEVDYDVSVATTVLPCFAPTLHRKKEEDDIERKKIPIGFGMILGGCSPNPRPAKVFRYSTHQVRLPAPPSVFCLNSS